MEKSLENDVHINELYVLTHRHDNELNNATTYTISLGYDETTGLVCAISYVKPGTTTTSK